MFAGGADEAKCKALCEKLGLDGLDNLLSAFSTSKDTLTSGFDTGRQFTSANAIFADNFTEVVRTYVEYLERFGAHLNCIVKILGLSIFIYKRTHAAHKCPSQSAK